MSVPVTDGLVLWLDAGEASKMTLSGDTVTEWRDKMGSSTKATTRGGAPTLVADGINGLPTVHFDTSSWMNDGVDRSAGPVTILYVSRETGGTNLRVLNATGNNWLLGYNGVRNRFYFEGWVYQGSVDADTDPHLYAATIGGAGKNSTVYAEGVLLASNQNGTQGPKILQLNGFMGATELSDCDISEVLVFNRVLSKDELNDVGYYLQQKYDLQGAYRGPEPVLDFDKSQVLLPTRKPGAPEITTSFILTNIGSTGTPPLEISAINTGSLAPFVIKSVVKNMTQALSAPYATSLDKAAGDQLVVTVALSPMTAGIFQGNFTVQSNDSANPSQRFDVTGCVAESGSPVTDGLVFHLDAAKGVIKDASDNVSDWLDLSGNGVGATTRAGAPTLVADGINGLPTVHFDTSSWMNDGVDRSAGPVTILYVSRETGG
ncbi:MAG TPA: hypothetical protein PLA90_14785, partial [Candidatus Sumerlaeota bacterium]|nr:hypothetical protein [Candidatus Sumerlaeota bacterium]